MTAVAHPENFDEPAQCSECVRPCSRTANSCQLASLESERVPKPFEDYRCVIFKTLVAEFKIGDDLQ